MSRQDIADYLCLRIETVSRTLSQLESEAAIAVAGSKRIMLRKRQKNYEKDSRGSGISYRQRRFAVGRRRNGADSRREGPSNRREGPARLGDAGDLAIPRLRLRRQRRSGARQRSFAARAAFATPSRQSRTWTGCWASIARSGKDRSRSRTSKARPSTIFDQLKELPRACSDTAPWSQSRIAAFVAATFADYYPSFQQRGIDWTARVAAAEPSFSKITDDAGLFEAIKSLLAGIEDQHVKLHADVNGEKLRFSPGEGATLSAVRAIVGDKVMDKYEWLAQLQAKRSRHHSAGQRA
jgi:hypothetical protein